MRAVVFGSALLALLGMRCQHSEGRSLGRDVSAEEVVGTWQMTPHTVNVLREAGYTLPVDAAQHQIVLRADGTCDFRTIPQVLTAGGQPEPRLDGPCRWKLDKVGQQALQLDVEGDPLRHPYYYFDEAPNGGLTLWQHVGDPDAWRYVEYVKQ